MVAAISLQELIHLQEEQATRALKLHLQQGTMANRICFVALAVPPLSLTPQSPVPALLSLPMLIPPCGELLAGGEGDQGKTDLKPNQTTK